MRNPVLARRQAIALVSLSVCLMLFIAWYVGLREVIPPPFEVPTDVLPLQVGDKIPWPMAEGWLNGDPVRPDDLEGKVVVVDIWNDLCPYCTKAAPDLVEVQKAYEQRNVEFVGLTARNSQSASEFLGHVGFTWPNAYGVAGMETAAPVVFVVGTDGRIAWCDDRSRTGHNIAHFGERIAAAIDDALHASEKNGRRSM